MGQATLLFARDRGGRTGEREFWDGESSSRRRPWPWGGSAVCIGRPYLWGLAAFGQPGVEMVLKILRAALRDVMMVAMLLGATGCHSTMQQNTGVPWGGLEHRKAGAGLARAELIIVLLHGYGSREDDLVGLASMIDSGVATGYIFPAAPIDLGSGRRGWNLPDGTGFDASRNQVLNLLAYIQQAYPQADVVVGGFSQGGTLAISLLAEDLPKVEGYLFFSPGWFLSHEPRQGSGLPPIFLSHGEKDTILPFSGSEALREYLGESGYAVTWKQFDGGHTIPATVITSANLFLAGLMK
jgi:predicted esterase